MTDCSESVMIIRFCNNTHPLFINDLKLPTRYIGGVGNGGGTVTCLAGVENVLIEADDSPVISGTYVGSGGVGVYSGGEYVE